MNIDIIPAARDTLARAEGFLSGLSVDVPGRAKNATFALYIEGTQLVNSTHVILN
jgi:hypothetical protein